MCLGLVFSPSRLLSWFSCRGECERASSQSNALLCQRLHGRSQEPGCIKQKHTKHKKCVKKKKNITSTNCFYTGFEVLLKVKLTESMCCTCLIAAVKENNLHCETHLLSCIWGKKKAGRWKILCKINFPIKPTSLV